MTHRGTIPSYLLNTDYFLPPDWWLVCRIISAVKTKDGSRSRSVTNRSVKYGRILPFVRRSQGKWELTECSQPSSASGPSSGLNWLRVNYRGRGTESLSPSHSNHSHSGVVNVKYRLHLSNGPQFGNLSAHTLLSFYVFGPPLLFFVAFCPPSFARTI